MKSKRLTNAITFFVVVLVLLAGTLYYFDSGKHTTPLQGPFISVSAVGETLSGQVNLNNFTVYVYATTTNASNNANDQLLYYGFSNSSTISGYLNASFYSVAGAWESVIPAASDNVSLSLYAFFDNYSSGNLSVFSFYDNLPYCPSSANNIAFNAKAVFNLSRPALRVPVAGGSIKSGFREKMQLINTTTLQNGSIVLGSYLSPSLTQASIAIEETFFPSESGHSSTGLLPFYGVSILNGSDYMQESESASFSGSSFNFSSMPGNVNLNSELSIGTVELHVSNFLVTTGYYSGSDFTQTSINVDSTVKVLSTSRTLTVSTADLGGDAYLSLFNEFISLHSQSISKVAPGTSNVTYISNQNWTSVLPSINSNLSTIANANRKSTVLVLDLGLSILISDFNFYGHNSSYSVHSMVTQQMGTNWQHISDFNIVDIAGTDVPFLEKNYVINTGSANLTSSFFFSNVNVSFTASSVSYYGSLPLTAAILT